MVLRCSSHVWIWQLDYKEIWAPKNCCFWTVVLEKTLESPLDCKEIQPVHPKGDQSWVFIGRTDVEAETPILWPRDVKSWLVWKDPDAGKDWGQEEKGTTEDEMVEWHHWLNGHEFGWAPGVLQGDREAWRAAVHGLAKSWTRLSDWTELYWIMVLCVFFFNLFKFLHFYFGEAFGCWATQLGKFPYSINLCFLLMHFWLYHASLCPETKEDNKKKIMWNLEGPRYNFLPWSVGT